MWKEDVAVGHNRDRCKVQGDKCKSCDKDQVDWESKQVNRKDLIHKQTRKIKV